MRRKGAWTIIVLLLRAFRARVLVLDDLGLLKKMQSLAPGSRRPGNARPANAPRGGSPPAVPMSTRNSNRPYAPPQRPQLPKAVVVISGNSSPARSLLSQTGPPGPANGRPTPAPMRPPVPRHPPAPSPGPSPRPAKPASPGRNGGYPRPGKFPNSSSSDGADRSNYRPGDSPVPPPRNALPHPQKIIAPRERNQPGAAPVTSDPRTSITTVISYVPSISSSASHSTPRSSIVLDSAALTSVNTAIPGGPQPPASSAMAGIPDRADIDDKKLRDYVNDHDNNIDHANIARKSFLSMKIQESQNANKRNETKLANLQRVYDEYLKRMDQVGSEISRVRSNIGTYRALLGNTATAIRELDSGMRENDTQSRLEEMEILRLNKAMNEEKNKVELLKEKSAMLKSRLKQLGTDENESISKLRTNESKLGIYTQLAENLENELRQLRDDIDEVESLKRKGQEVLDKLEIEHNQYENDRHLPLFVRYT